jgi:predicted dehydrogenase
VRITPPAGGEFPTVSLRHVDRPRSTGLEELIAKTRSDAAIVCTPTHVRKDVVIPLIEAGIPVLCEKPFAETYAEAALLAQAAESTGTPLAVNQNFRRHFTFALGRAILKEGRLGRPLHLVQVAHVLRHDAGWWLERRRYVMSVMSVHWFDGCRYLLDDEPAWVCCRGVNSPATEGGEDTAVSVLLQFAKGTVVSLSESFSSFTDRADIEERAGGVWNQVYSPKLEGLRAAADIVRFNTVRSFQALVNVNNHYEGSAPLTAERFLAVLREQPQPP